MTKTRPPSRNQPQRRKLFQMPIWLKAVLLLAAGVGLYLLFTA